MRYTLTIDCGNAAFADGNAGAEIARILREAATLAERLKGQTPFTRALHDINGNKVGQHKITGKGES